MAIDRIAISRRLANRKESGLYVYDVRVVDEDDTVSEAKGLKEIETAFKKAGEFLKLHLSLNAPNPTPGRVIRGGARPYSPRRPRA